MCKSSMLAWFTVLLIAVAARPATADDKKPGDDKVIEVTAAELAAAFEENFLRASQKYNDAKLKVTGEVDKPGKESLTLKTGSTWKVYLKTADQPPKGRQTATAVGKLLGISTNVVVVEVSEVKYAPVAGGK